MGKRTWNTHRWVMYKFVVSIDCNETEPVLFSIFYIYQLQYCVE